MKKEKPTDSKPDPRIMEEVLDILRSRSAKALSMAKKEILAMSLEGRGGEALKHYATDWDDTSHPGILSLTCEAVGGQPERVVPIQVATLILTAAMDVHDDIIDGSRTKNGKTTVFGKFGKDISILVGDALLFKGLTMLHEACETLPKEQKKAILELVKQAFFGISSAEAEETSFRGKFDVSPEEYLDMIRTKVAVAEATAKIGVILGDGTPQEVEELGHYGRTLAILMTIRDEFVDVF